MLRANPERLRSSDVAKPPDASAPPPATAGNPLADANEQIHALTARLHAIEQSSSWRMTWPLRWALGRAPVVRLLIRRSMKVAWWTVSLQLPHKTKEYLAARRVAPAPGLVAVEIEPPPVPDVATVAPSAVPAPVVVDLSETRVVPPAGLKMSVVICVHNALEDVRRCITSVLEHSRAPREIILVDDGSAADTHEFLRTVSRAPGVTLIRHDVSRGYTTSANDGIDASSGEYVVLLNSDTVVTSGWLNAIESTFDSHPRTGIVGPLSNTASWQSVPTVTDGGDWASNPIPDGFGIDDVGRFVSERQPSHHRLPFINGFCFAVRKQVFTEIGTFDAQSFPVGYGEENDFCIRARNKGWDLRVADNCYTWHAQSRSFTDERRKVLQNEASTVLGRLHDATRDVNTPAGFCRTSLGMAGVREWVRRRFEREAMISDCRKRYAGARMAFVLPVGGVAGGANVIFQEVEALRRFGIDVALINVEDRRTGILACYPEYRDQWSFVADTESIPSALRRKGPFDAVVTTAYMSTFWSPKQAELPKGTRSAYYIQDFEPLFHDDSDLGRPYALASYRWDLEQTLLTKTHWNRDLVAGATGRVPHLIGPSVDVDRFQPVDRARAWPPDDGIRICAMVRPDTPRRSPEATYRLLATIASQFGSSVQCHTFGCPDVGMEAYRSRYPGQVVHHGEVPWRRMRSFLCAMDVFIDLSSWQAMGLTLMEAMASGLLVIGPTNGGAREVVTHGHDGFLVDTSTDDAAFAVVEQVMRREHDVLAMRHKAIAGAHAFYPEKPAAALANLVLCRS